MITAIRKLIKSKAVRVLLILIVASVGGLFSLTIFKKDVGGPWIVNVNGESVSYNSFVRKSMENEERIRTIRSQYGQLADLIFQSMGMTLDPRILAAKQLIQEELLNQLSDELDINLDEEFIEQKLGDLSFVYRELSHIIPPALVDPQYGIDMNSLSVYLRRKGMATSDFWSEVKSSIKRNFVARLLIGSVYEPEWRVRSKYTQKELAKKFNVHTLNFNNYIDKVKKESISKSELKKYFDNQNTEFKRYWVPEKRLGKVWEFDADSYGYNIGEDEVKSYYDDYKQKKYVESPVKLIVRKIMISFSNPEEQKAAHEKMIFLHAELSQNKSAFEKKAKEFSEDKETAQNGGLMPEFSRGTYDREFEKAAFLLKNDDDISAIVKVGSAFEIVQRVKRIPAVVKSFQSVKTEIKKTLIGRKFKDQFYKDMKRFLQGDDVGEDEREVILKKAKNIRNLKSVERSDSKVSKALFRAKENKFSFYVDGKKGFVVQTKKIEKKYLPSIDVIENVVKGDLYEERASRLLKETLKIAHEKAKSLSSDELRSEFKTKVEIVGMIKLDDSEKMKKLNEKGIPIDVMMKLEKVGDVGTSMGDRDGYLFVLNEVETFDEKDFEKKKVKLRKELQLESSQLIVASLVAFLNRIAKIEINKSIVNISE